MADAGKKALTAWKNTKKSQKALIIAVVILTIIALSVVLNMANQVEYAALFSGLSDEEAGNIITALNEEGVEVKSAPNGTLLVPKDKVDELRYTLQSEGLPGSDNFDYTLYSENAGSFGATDKDKAYYEQAQLQQNIAQTINKLGKIKNSTVLLALAKDSPYVLSGDDEKVSSASVMVTLKSSGDQLSQSDVDAIRAIVSKAVPALTEDNISIVDQNMHLYGTASEGSGGTTQVDAQIQLQKKVSSELEQQVLNLLSPVFGPENLTASVNVILDFDKNTTNSLTLSPPTNDAENMGIITSMKQTTERLQNAGTTPEGEPGVDPNGGAPTYQEIDAAAQDSTYYNTVTEVNAEVNEINQQIEEAQGDISDLSATLIINGDDSLTDLLPEVRQQIATAIGVPEDKITVSAMPFEENTLYAQAMEEQAKEMEAQRTSDMIKNVVVPLAIIAGIMVMLLIILREIKKKRESDLEQERMANWTEMQQQEQEEQPSVDVVADEELNVEELLQEKNDNMVSQVRQLVDRDPDAIAQLLRNWLSDDIGGR
nr:flagellar basal-body MS-ring/collar protein FliF [Christensenella intestinihominis]